MREHIYLDSTYSAILPLLSNTHFDNNVLHNYGFILYTPNRYAYPLKRFYFTPAPP